MAFPDLGGVFNNLKNIFNHIYNSIRNSFNVVANTIINTLNSSPIIRGVKRAIGKLSDGIRQAWTNFTKWLHRGLDWTWKQVGKAVDWLSVVLKKVFAGLLALMDQLFRITEPLMMKIGTWQAKMQYSLGKSILSTW